MLTPSLLPPVALSTQLKTLERVNSFYPYFSHLFFIYFFLCSFPVCYRIPFFHLSFNSSSLHTLAFLRIAHPPFVSPYQIKSHNKQFKLHRSLPGNFVAVCRRCFLSFLPRCLLLCFAACCCTHALPCHLFRVVHSISYYSSTVFCVALLLRTLLCIPNPPNCPSGVCMPANVH